MSNRLLRINGEVQKALSKIISNDLRDPRINSLITVTRVEVSADLSHAKVFVTILSENDTYKQQTYKILNASSSFIRKALSQELNMRLTPEIHFFLDDTWEKGEHMDNLISKLNIPKE